MKWPWVALFCVGITVLCGAIWLSLPQPPQALPSPIYVSQRTDPASVRSVKLHDTVLRWQALPIHQQTTKTITALTETLGAGVCVLDVNNDGWQDLFVVGGSGHTRHYGKRSWWHTPRGNQLLLNRQGRYLEDVSASAGVNLPMWGMGCASADFDGDGWLDLVVTGVGDNRLYQNIEGKRFEDITARSGLVADHWSTGASVADFNNDGLPDLYITNYVHLRKGAKTFERNKGFETGDVTFDPTLFDPLPNRLYLNKGQGTFEDVAAAMGVDDVLGRSLGARWVDLNQDQWLDLIVINDAQTPNQVYLNRSAKTFERSERRFTLLETPWSHDIELTDLTRDGQPDLLISRHGGYAPVLLTSSQASGYADLAWNTRFASTQRIFQNGWGIASGDFNNDGIPDIYVGNGLARPDSDSMFIPQAQNNTLLLGSAQDTYIPISNSEDAYPMSARGVITADLDNDGVLEIIVSNNNNPLQILEPDTAAKQHWLGLDIPDAPIGTRIKVTLNERTLTHFVVSPTGFLSQGDSRIHIGLGSDTGIRQVTLQTPSGAKIDLGPLTADRYFRLTINDHIAPTPVDIPTAHLAVAEQLQRDTQAMQYLAELLVQLKTPNAIALLYSLWDTQSASLAPELLRTLNQENASQLLWLLRSSLHASDPSLQIQAIQRLHPLELEFSTNWLIPLLQAKDAEVACAAAKTFEFYFNEEEAVTHRKYLAVAPLIKVLQSTDPARQICAANALANAERKRAVDPLLQLVLGSSTPDARAAAVRALGLIRDTKAIPTLRALISHPENHHPRVVASALVALKRLDTPDLKSLLPALLNPESINTSLQFRISVLAYLLGQDDGLVFKRDLLAPYQAHALQALLRLPPQQLTPDQADAAIDFIQYSPTPDALDWMHRLWPALADQQRVHWLLVMSHLQPSSLPAEFDAFLETATPDGLIALARGVQPNRLALTDRQLQTLMPLATSGDLSRHLMPDLLLALDPPTRLRLSTLLARDPAAGWNTSPDPALCRLLAPEVQSEAVLNTAPNNHAWIRCAYRSTRWDQWHAKAVLQLRIALNRLASSDTLTAHEHASLIMLAARRDPLVARLLLVPLLPTLDDASFHEALNVLMHHQLTGVINKLLWQIVRTSSLPPGRRFHAARALLAIEPPAAVIKVLNTEVFRHEIL